MVHLHGPSVPVHMCALQAQAAITVALWECCLQQPTLPQQVCALIQELTLSVKLCVKGFAVVGFQELSLNLLL